MQTERAQFSQPISLNNFSFTSVKVGQSFQSSFFVAENLVFDMRVSEEGLDFSRKQIFSNEVEIFRESSACTFLSIYCFCF